MPKSRGAGEEDLERTDRDVSSFMRLVLRTCRKRSVRSWAMRSVSTLSPWPRRGWCESAIAKCAVGGGEWPSWGCVGCCRGEVGVWAGMNGRAAGLRPQQLHSPRRGTAATGSVREGGFGGECLGEQGPLHPDPGREGDGEVETGCTGCVGTGEQSIGPVEERMGGAELVDARPRGRALGITTTSRPMQPIKGRKIGLVRNGISASAGDDEYHLDALFCQPSVARTPFHLPCASQATSQVL